MLKKIFEIVLGLFKSTSESSISEVKTLLKFYAYAVLFLIFLLVCLVIFGLFSLIF